MPREARAVRVERTRPVAAVAACGGDIAIALEASGGQEETVAVRGGEESSVHTVLGRPCAGSVVVQLLPFLLGGHTPTTAPVGRGRVVLGQQGGQTIAPCVFGHIITVIVLVGAQVAGGLRLGLAPGEVVAVVLGVVGTHVAGGPQQAARQAEVDIGVVAAAAAACLGGEALLAAVDGHQAVGGVGTHIIGGAGAQAGQAAGEAARARAVGSVAVAQGRVVARAPANASGGNFEAAAVGHRAAAQGTVARNVGHLGGAHHGDAAQSGEAQLLAVGQAIVGSRVSAHIVGGARVQTYEGAAEAAYARFLGGVAAVDVGARHRAPAHATLEHVRALGQHHHATCNGSRGGDVGRHGRCHGVGGRLGEDQLGVVGARRVVHIAPAGDEVRESSPPASARIGGGAELRVDDVARHRGEVAQGRGDVHDLRVGIADPVPARIQGDCDFLCLGTYACSHHAEQAHQKDKYFLHGCYF